MRRFDALEEYRVALAELPLSTEAAPGPAGAVVVLDGGGPGIWVEEIEVALAAGALGVVVDGPGPPIAGPASMASVCPAGLLAERGAPVLVARRFLPRGLVDAALAPEVRDEGGPRLLTVEASGGIETGVFRDALGWARLLAGSPLALVAAGAGARGATAHADSEDGVPVLISRLRGAGPVWLRVCSFGAVEVEVEIDAGTGSAGVTVRAADGERVVRVGFESRARGELWRAVSAVRASAWPDDLTDMIADLELERRIQDDAGIENSHKPFVGDL